LLYRRRGPISHAATAMLRLLRPKTAAAPAAPKIADAENGTESKKSENAKPV
jgi:hypothetical protein